MKELIIFFHLFLLINTNTIRKFRFCRENDLEFFSRHNKSVYTEEICSKYYPVYLPFKIKNKKEFSVDFIYNKNNAIKDEEFNNIFSYFFII